MAATGAVPAAASPVAAPCPTAHWVSAWALSPSDSSGPAIRDETLRSLVYAHAGGTAVRVRLSNRLGTGTVSVGAASIGPRDAGAALKSTGALTFGRQQGVVLGAGQDAVSDPLALTVAQFDELEVSLYVSSAAAPPSRHQFAAQPGFTAAGDHTGDVDGAAFTPYPAVGQAAPQDVALVSGVDVLTDASSGTVVALGDSLTDGFQGAADRTPVPDQLGQNSRWPDALARLLAGDGRDLSVVDAGITGNKVLVDGSGGPAATTRLAADVLDQPGLSTVVVVEGINDIAAGTGADAVEAGLTTIVRNIHGAGATVLLGTLTPASLTPGREVERAALNTWVRTQTLADGVVDFDAAVADPADRTALEPTYDGGDHVHLTAAGYRAMAEAVPLDDLPDGGCKDTAGVTADAPLAVPNPPGQHHGLLLALAAGLLALLAAAAVLVLRRRRPEEPVDTRPAGRPGSR